MDRSEAARLIDEARDIARQLHAPGSIEDKTQLLRRADELEHRVTDQRRGRDQQALTAQLNALGVPSHVAGQPRAATVYDSLRMASWEIGARRLPSRPRSRSARRR